MNKPLNDFSSRTRVLLYFLNYYSRMSTHIHISGGRECRVDRDLERRGDKSESEEKTMNHLSDRTLPTKCEASKNPKEYGRSSDRVNERRRYLRGRHRWTGFRRVPRGEDSSVDDEVWFEVPLPKPLTVATDSAYIRPCLT